MKHSVTQYYEHPLEATRNELKPQLFRVSLQSSEFGAPRIDPGLFLSLSLSLSYCYYYQVSSLALAFPCSTNVHTLLLYARERERWRDGEGEGGDAICFSCGWRKSFYFILFETLRFILFYIFFLKTARILYSLKRGAFIIRASAAFFLDWIYITFLFEQGNCSVRSATRFPVYISFPFPTQERK